MTTEAEAAEKILDEIHAIRATLHERTKDMTTAERVEYFNSEAEEFCREKNIQIKYPDWISRSN
jgi:macrodomain Ter protein organizer (MatP/YcbG family)